MMLKEHKEHYRETVRLGLPVIFAQLGQVTVGLVDNMMIGRIGSIELAAASFANTLFTIILFFAIGYATALTPLAGEAYGRKDYTKIASFLKNGLTANMSVSIIFLFFTAICYYSMPYMGQPEAIIPMAQSYFLILGLSIPPLMFFLTGKQIADGMANTKISMYITLLANIVNIIGNYIFINGKIGMPQMGLNGAGMGTLISRVFMGIAIIYVFLKNKEFTKVTKIINKTKNCISTVKQIYKLGLPLGIQMVTESSAFIVATIMMGWMGAKGLAAHQIVISLSTLGFMIYQGIGVSTTIRVSNILGKQTLYKLPVASKVSSRITVALVVVISSFFLLFKDLLPRLFTDDKEIIALASQFIIWMVAYQIFDALQIIYSGFLKGLSDVKIPGLMVIFSYFVVAIPFSYLAAFKWGLNESGIWIGFPVGLSICAMLFYLRLKNQMKKVVAT